MKPYGIIGLVSMGISIIMWTIDIIQEGHVRGQTVVVFVLSWLVVLFSYIQ